jgi:hypothetical protein
MLVEGCTGKASTFIKVLDKDKKDTQDHHIESLKEK